jgi:hypothetical protein
MYMVLVIKWSRPSAEVNTCLFIATYPQMYGNRQFIIMPSAAYRFSRIKRVEKSPWYTLCILELHFDIITP